MNEAEASPQDEPRCIKRLSGMPDGSVEICGDIAGMHCTHTEHRRGSCGLNAHDFEPARFRVLERAKGGPQDDESKALRDLFEVCMMLADSDITLDLALSDWSAEHPAVYERLAGERAYTPAAAPAETEGAKGP